MRISYDKARSDEGETEKGTFMCEQELVWAKGELFVWDVKCKVKHFFHNPGPGFE